MTRISLSVSLAKASQPCLLSPINQMEVRQHVIAHCSIAHSQSAKLRYQPKITRAHSVALN